MRPYLISALVAAPLLLTLAACGGGDPETADAAADTADAAPMAAERESASGRAQALAVTPSGPSDSTRIAAATVTAQSNSNACAPIRPFYWEIGDSAAKKASGSVVVAGSAKKYSATLPMSIASASKWIYGTYVAQKTGGVLSEQDRRFLSMRSGYIGFSGCEPTDTVDSCVARGNNNKQTPEAVDRYYYGGGHMENHASLIGLGTTNNTTLASAIKQQIGSDIPLMYSQPQLAGGVVMAPDGYAKMLRKILGGSLHMKNVLGTGAACTNVSTCGTDQAIYAPIPLEESWGYSVGHWVESDPIVGDGAFSSPGAFGFYPWIDASKTYYGVLARMVPNGAFTSVQCGRLIRKAWMTGTAM